jgi:hypothetical protein
VAPPDGSVDIVTTRAVLIYVKDKASAMREISPGAETRRADQPV